MNSGQRGSSSGLSEYIFKAVAGDTQLPRDGPRLAPAEVWPALISVLGDLQYETTSVARRGIATFRCLPNPLAQRRRNELGASDKSHKRTETPRRRRSQEVQSRQGALESRIETRITVHKLQAV